MLSLRHRLLALAPEFHPYRLLNHSIDAPNGSQAQNLARRVAAATVLASALEGTLEEEL
jgi:hypothetical protein